LKEHEWDYIKYRIERANETFQEATLLAANEKWNGSINRLYYACFYIVTAILATKNINPKTHLGVKTKFHQEFIKTELLDKNLSELYSDLFAWRQSGDYDDFITFDRATVQPLILQVKNFIESVNNLIT